MSTAIFSVAKAKKREDGWYHPNRNQLLKQDTKDVYVFEIINAADSSIMMSMVLDNNCLEQLADDIEKTLTIEPVAVRLCQP